MKPEPRSLYRLANRTSQYGITPAPPRGLQIASGVLSWEKPVDLQGTTHFRVYADNEGNLVRQVSVGQRQVNDGLTANRVFVSAWNEASQLESPLVCLNQAIAPTGGGGGGGSSFQPGGYEDMSILTGPPVKVVPDIHLGKYHRVTLNANAILIDYPIFTTGTLVKGLEVVIVIRQDGTGGWVPTWNANYIGIADYDVRTDPNISQTYYFVMRPTDLKLEVVSFASIGTK